MIGDRGDELIQMCRWPPLVLAQQALVMGFEALLPPTQVATPGFDIELSLGDQMKSGSPAILQILVYTNLDLKRVVLTSAIILCHINKGMSPLDFRARNKICQTSCHKTDNVSTLFRAAL